MTDLPNQGIFDRGELIGLWDVDPATKQAVTLALVPWSPAVTAAVQAAAERTSYFVRDELGERRGMSLDSAKAQLNGSLLSAHFSHNNWGRVGCCGTGYSFFKNWSRLKQRDQATWSRCADLDQFLEKQDSD